MADRWVWALACVGLLLAGCFGSQTPDAIPSRSSDSTQPDPGAPANVSWPTLPRIDRWGPATELVLFEGNVESTVECSSAYAEAAQAWAGCAEWGPSDGLIVPEGTAKITIDADASAARRSGRWGAYLGVTYAHRWQFDNRSVEGEPTTGPTGTWSFSIGPKDWEPATHAASVYRFGVYAYGDSANALEGPIHVSARAERDTAWVGTAPLDRWKIPEWNPGPERGVLTLHDANITLETSGSAAPSPVATPEIPFTRTVPYGTTHVVVGLRWGPIQNCLTPGACSVRGAQTSGSGYNSISGALVNALGPDYRVLVYSVPDMVREESHESNDTINSYGPWIDDCSPEGLRDAGGESSCLAPNAGVLRTDLRLLIEAWDRDVDLASVKARLGVA